MCRSKSALLAASLYALSILMGCGGEKDVEIAPALHQGVPVRSVYLSLATLKSQPQGCASTGNCFATPDGLVTPLGRKEAVEQFYPASKQADLTTLQRWLVRFGFPERREGESIHAYRARAEVSVYYNANELGLGREIGCSRYDDTDPRGQPAQGLACYVSNYGTSFGDPDDALREAELGEHPRSTVVISYQPSLPPEYQVQFAAFDSNADGRGHLTDTGQLDTMGPRPVPQICTNCHGGVYDAAKHLVRGARFLPVNVFSVEYDAVAPYRQSDQLETLRHINNMALEVDSGAPAPDVLLTAAQKDYLRTLYALPTTAKSIPAGARALADAAPGAWSIDDKTRAIWRHAILPYCATCHSALPPVGPNYVEGFRDFSTRWPAMKIAVCNTYSMPHAQPTIDKFWTAKVEVRGRDYPSAKSFLAAMMNGGTDDCEYVPGNGCNVGDDQKASNLRCGDPAASGRYCNLTALGGEGACEHGCGPDTGGVLCENVGANLQQCGVSKKCEPCGRLGQLSCSGVCSEGQPSADRQKCIVADTQDLTQ